MSGTSLPRVNRHVFSRFNLDFFFYSGKKQSNQEDLKEMGDISSGMSSSIMQIYLKQVLESFFHSQSTVRHFALSVITLTLSQGLIHPVQVCSLCVLDACSTLSLSCSYKHGLCETVVNLTAATFLF